MISSDNLTIFCRRLSRKKKRKEEGGEVWGKRGEGEVGTCRDPFLSLVRTGFPKGEGKKRNVIKEERRSLETPLPDIFIRPSTSPRKERGGGFQKRGHVSPYLVEKGERNVEGKRDQPIGLFDHRAAHVVGEGGKKREGKGGKKDLKEKGRGRTE